MFVEKFTSIDLSQHQIRRFFLLDFDFRQSIQRDFIQINITFYFKFAINQKTTINQNSKTSNSKSFQQHTLAKSNRVKFTFFIKNVFEKSIVLLYKTSIFSRLSVSKISSILSYETFVIFDRLFRSFIFNVIFVFCQTCRICKDIFESNNVLHYYLRAIHFNQTSRRYLKNFRERDHLDRNLENL